MVMDHFLLLFMIRDRDFLYQMGLTEGEFYLLSGHSPVSKTAKKFGQ
jgi:hypothetical protein